MLISPTEPASLRATGRVSLVPENYGCDILLFSKSYGPVGVQRKELSDLISSVRDGRLGRQLVAMKQLELTVLLLEGRPRWTNDGSLLSHGNWTRTQHNGLIWSVQSRGVWVNTSDDLTDTIAWLSLFQKWLEKDRTKGSSLETRPKGRDEFGKEARGRDFGIHLLQSFPGVGREVAGNVVDHFKGVPLQWTVSAEELKQVKGIGEGRAKQLTSMLGTEMPPPLPKDPFPKQKGSGKDSGRGTSRGSRSNSRTAQASPKSSPTTDLESIDDWITIEELR